MGELSHLAYVEFAAKQKKRKDEHDNAGQSTVHPEQKKECSQKLDAGGQKVGDVFGEKGDNVVDVAFYAVDEIAGMETFQTLPVG
jgi:hypothetical protein